MEIFSSKREPVSVTFNGGALDVFLALFKKQLLVTPEEAIRVCGYRYLFDNFSIDEMISAIKEHEGWAFTHGTDVGGACSLKIVRVEKKEDETVLAGMGQQERYAGKDVKAFGARAVVLPIVAPETGKVVIVPVPGPVGPPKKVTPMPDGEASRAECILGPTLMAAIGLEPERQPAAEEPAATTEPEV